MRYLPATKIVGPVTVILCRVSLEVGALGGMVINLSQSLRFNFEGTRYRSKAFRVIESVFVFLDI